MTKTALYATLIALFIIPFLPLYVANGQFFPFITGKGFAFRILVEVAVAGWVVLMLADAKYRPRFSWTMVFYGALVAWMFIANLLGVNPHKAFWSNFERMDGWVTLVHVFAFFLVAGAVLPALNLWRKWWLTFVSASVLVAFVGFLQLSGALAINQGGVRLDATFGNSAYLAAYLLFAIAISLWQGLESKEKWLRYSLFVLTGVHVILLFYTATRGAILGALGGAVLGTALFAFLHSGKNTKKIAAGLLAGLIVLVGGFWLLRDADFIKNDPTLGRLSSISISEGSTRFAIWNIGLKGVAERPLHGWGQEGFNYVFNTHYEPHLYAQEAWFDRAHDVYIDWLIAGGIPALILFLGLLISGAWALLRTDKISRTSRVFLLSAMAAYAFQAIFVFDNLFTYVPMAMILAMAHFVSSKKIAKIENAPVVKQQLLQGAVMPAAVVILIAVIWIVNVPNIRAAHDLIPAVTPTNDPLRNIAYFKEALADGSFARQEIREHIVQYGIDVSGMQGIPDSTRAEMGRFSVVEMADEVAGNPTDVRLRYYLALAYRIAGDPKSALAQMDAAIALSPEKQMLYIDKGNTALEVGDKQIARAAFDKAYELDTRNTEAAAYAAAGRVFAGDFAGANTLLLEAFGTTTVDNQALLRAYYETKQFGPFIAIWQERVAKNPESPDARFGLAAAYAVANRIPEAVAEIRATIAAYPSTAQQGAAMLQQLGAGVR